MRTIIDFLSDPKTYQDGTANVITIETHISYVFLTQKHAYKLKKPLRYDFLDYSTLEKRREACQDEVILNKRLAPDVYLGVTEIKLSSSGKLNLEQGTLVETVVKMRRLPEELFLHNLIATKKLREIDIQKLSNYLVDFYRRVPPDRVEPSSFIEKMHSHIRNNADVLLSLCKTDLEKWSIKKTHSTQLLYLTSHEDQIIDRIMKGKIVEGHGDLRPEHICMESPLRIFDCIEFNKDYRTLDIVDELSFFAEECEFLDRKNIGNYVLAQYLKLCADDCSSNLINFYKSYRSSVRAKVAALTLEQCSASKVPIIRNDLMRHIAIAKKYSERLDRPRIIIICGLMGTGKSTLASSIAEKYYMDLLQTDMIRREVFTEPKMFYKYGQGNYSPENKERIYKILYKKLEHSLRNRSPVIIDGGFINPKQRLRISMLTKEYSMTPLFVHCECPEDIVFSRMSKRGREDPFGSEGRPALYEKQRQEANFEFADAPHIKIDTRAPINLQVGSVLTHLFSDWNR